MRIGKDVKTRKPAYLTPEVRKTHMHVIGSTGVGKSKFLEWMIRNDIYHGNGLCLLDPHGSLYDEIVKWVAEYEIHKHRKIILLDLLEPNWSFGFNPLQQKQAHITFVVDRMVAACAKVWGDADMDKTPLLKRCLTIIFHALAEKNMSLWEAQYLSDANEVALRYYLTEGLNNPVIQREWNKFNNYDRKRFEDYMFSTENRMLEFLKSPLIRNIIGQTGATIDFRQAMEEGHIVLINLASKDIVSDDNAQLIGSLLINDLFINARSRPKDPRPFYLYIDEAGLFVNDDVSNILTQTRKYGLHLILAHQHLDQLKNASMNVYRSVMGSARTKVVFGGLEYEDAEVMVKNMFLNLDLQEWKTELTRPAVVSYSRSWFENFAESRGRSAGESRGQTKSRAKSEASGSGAGAADQFSQGYVMDPETGMGPFSQNWGQTFSESDFNSVAFSESEAESYATSAAESESQSSGRSEGLEPVLGDLPVFHYSLDEQIWRSIALMINQPTQHAIIKLPGEDAQFIKVPTVSETKASDRWIGRSKTEMFKAWNFIRPFDEVEKIIDDRSRELKQNALRAMARPPAPLPAPGQPEGEVIDLTDYVVIENEADYEESY